jgi:hypothetical protein
MSHTVPLLVLVLVVEDDDLDVELSPAGPLVEDSAAELSDAAGTVVTAGCVTPPKLDGPAPLPQAARLLVSVRARRARMGSQA